jgi:predicted DNA-binding protein (MmcQ/YjbR family)
MNIEALRALCLSFPGATEHVQWGDHLVFKVGGKMFAVTSFEAAAPHVLSFKCAPEVFTDITEHEDIVPAPYLARASWAAFKPGTRCRRPTSRGWSPTRTGSCTPGCPGRSRRRSPVAPEAGRSAPEPAGRRTGTAVRGAATASRP